MSEEIRRGKALDDAELEGVSGGYSQSFAKAAAWHVCKDCNWTSHPPCKGSEEKLAAYIVEHDIDIYDPEDCPFRTW